MIPSKLLFEKGKARLILIYLSSDGKLQGNKQRLTETASAVYELN